MLDQDQIDAMAEGDEVMDRVQDRMKRGTPGHREIMPDELHPFIMTALYWRQVAIQLWQEKIDIGTQSMGLGPVPDKYAKGVKAEQ